MFSSNGAPVRSNTITLDGAITMNLHGNTGGATGSTLGIDGIKEFRVITNGFSAKYGENCRTTASGAPLLINNPCTTLTTDGLAAGVVAPSIAPYMELFPQANLTNTTYTFPATNPTNIAYGQMRKHTALHMLGELGSLEFRAEFFNIFNHANFGIPTGTAFGSTNDQISATAGQITYTVTTSRQIQLSLKLVF
jgi:hypothetical protein